MVTLLDGCVPLHSPFISIFFFSFILIFTQLVIVSLVYLLVVLRGIGIFLTRENAIGTQGLTSRSTELSPALNMSLGTWQGASAVSHDVAIIVIFNRMSFVFIKLSRCLKLLTWPWAVSFSRYFIFIKSYQLIHSGPSQNSAICIKDALCIKGPS